MCVWYPNIHVYLIIEVCGDGKHSIAWHGMVCIVGVIVAAVLE